MRSLAEALPFFQQRVYQKLPALLPSVHTTPQQLNRALHYVCQQPGKAIRPFLVYATGLLFDTPYTELDAMAIAVELTHLYSLVHDDLPSMDDDDFRRNRPTCHKAFSESTAILVGDGLQTLAFQVLSDPEYGSYSAELRVQLIQILAKAAGVSGMVKGQAIDIESIDKPLTQSELEIMHLGKTGALIEASVQAGALIGLHFQQDDLNQTKLMLSNLRQYAKNIGLAFQIQDDILDATQTSEQLGKRAQKDASKNKPNFVTILGLTSAQQKAQHCVEEALKCLMPFDLMRAELLIALTHHMIKREC